ncbi:MAG TPA: response regulator [Sulfuricella sp.]|nr:response regulator [Sulfuricella sp.]
MAIELDIGPLTWVKGEIDQALDLARQSLSGFLDNTGDFSPLRFCQTHLHQVTGAIQMVGLEGAACVSTAIEKGVAALEQQQADSSVANVEAIDEAISALSRYLADLLDGEPDVPLKLFPVYRKLHEIRGATDFAESDLFFPDLSERAPKDPVAQPLAEVELPVLARAERARYQWGLLKFLRDNGDLEGIEAMRAALLAIERAQPQPAQRTFWWVAGGLVESLIDKGANLDIEDKRLLGKLDQQIRKLADSSFKVAERLLRDVLYRVACSEPVGERVKQVKRAFDLDACLPPAALAGAAQIAASRKARGKPLPLPAAPEIQASLQRIEEVLDAFFRDTAKRRDIPALEPVLEQVSDVLKNLGLEKADQLFAACRASIRRFADPAYEPGLREMEGVAEGLSSLGSYLGEIQRGRADAEKTIERIWARLTGEPEQDAGDRPPAAFPEEAVPATEEAALPPAAEMMIGDTAMPRALFDIFMPEAKQRVAVLQEELARLEEHPDVPVREEFMRAAHTLCGISRTAGLPALADLGFGLEEWLTEMLKHPQPARGKQIAVTGDAVVALNLMVQAVERQIMPKPARQLMRSLQALVKKARAEREKAAMAERAVGRAVGFVAAAPATTASRDDIDPEVLPLFLEEAESLYPLIGAQMRCWREEPADRPAPQELQRSLHTFKGGARMAGALQLGDLIHNLEARVVDAMGGGAPSAALFDRLFAGYDRIGGVLGRLRAKPEAPVAVGEPASPPMEKPGAQQLRVSIDVLDRLVNEAGEISIARSRVEAEMQGFKQSLLELTENVVRLRGQVREIEIQAESRMQSSHGGGAAEVFDPLEFDRFTRFQELTRLLAESVNDVSTVQQGLLKNLGEADTALRHQARQSHDLQQDLMRIRTVPLSSIAERLQRIVRQTAEELGKKAGLEIQGGEVELDRGVLEKMIAPFEHLLRNSLAHGVENAAERRRAGKPESGAIRLDAHQEGNEIALTLSDDGAGFDLAGIRSQAVALGRLAPHSEIEPARLIDMMFDPGFSTATEVTQVAGRGIGLDVARSEIAGLGGRIDAAPGADGGAVFTIYLPLTLAVTQAVLVRCGEKIHALPSAMVELVQEFKAAALEECCRKGEIDWQNNRYPLFYLARLLGERESMPEPHRHNPVLFLKSGSQRVAVRVDEIIGSREAVVKNIGPQLARIPGIAGATVLGNGRVALIINPLPLAQRMARQTPAANAVEPPMVPMAAPLIMVVDDSLTVRKATSRLLAKEGYRVVTAKDGVDALEQMQEALPDAMLMDIEMPHMDGFELTRTVRDDARTAHIPIIMITSRTAEKHRNYARELGVNAYLGKPYQEEELLGRIADFVKG